MERKVSIILCTRNRRDALARCLQSLDQLAVNAVNGEVVLVDNGSEDDTLAVMYAYWEQAVCPVQVVLEPRAGLSHARDTGLRYATGDLFIFLDDDCYFGEHYLFYAVQAFAKGEFDYASGRILNYDPTDAPYGSNEREQFELTPAHSFIPVGKFQGTNFIMTRKLYQKVGGYDPLFGTSKGFRCEDIDYCARASAAGFAGAHLPQLVVFHHHGRKPGESRNRLHKANAVAAGGYYAKNIVSGRFFYLSGWFKTFRPTHKKEFLWQLYGAFKYLGVRLQKLFERTAGSVLHRLIHPRKFHAFCVGTNKSGTQSINEMFQEKYRSMNDAEEVQFAEAMLAYEFGSSTREQMIDYLKKRDRRLYLEMDCSTLNIHLIELLVEIFPKAKFVLTIRDCVSWLEAEINNTLAHPIPRHLRTLWDYRCQAHQFTHSPGEIALKEAGLYTLDGYFHYWNWHNSTMLKVIPPHRLLIVKSRELGRSPRRIGDFLNINHHTLDASKIRPHGEGKQFDLFKKLDPELVKSKAREHCPEVMAKIFPNTWAALNQQESTH